MSVQPPPADVLERRAGLFTPGPRLGWVFRDRRQLAAPFPEPAPDLEAMRAAAAERARADDASYRKFRKFLGLPSGILLLVLLLANGCQANINGTGPPLLSDFIALLICAPGIAITTVKWQRSRRAAERATRVGEDHQQALAAWQEREAAWQRAELARLADADEWGSAGPPPGTRRVDVFGGSLPGWQALLTTHGTSLLAGQPLLVVDLSGEMVCAELVGTARAAGVPSATWLLPSDLGASGLLAGLTAAQFADAFAEAVYAGEPGGARAERAVDTRVLEQLHGALGADVTLPRLAAAVRAALGHADDGGLLTGAERAAVTGEVFPADHRRQIEPNLVRIEAFLAGLARHAGPGPPPGGPPPGAAGAGARAGARHPAAARVPHLPRSGARRPQRPRRGTCRAGHPVADRAGGRRRRAGPGRHHRRRGRDQPPAHRAAGQRVRATRRAADPAVPPPARLRAVPARRRRHRVHAAG